LLSVSTGDTGKQNSETRAGDTLAEFLHKKSGSSLWYYRRRYPQDVAKVLCKPIYMQSLGTSNKREAEQLSRRVSVQFDAICHEARVKRDLTLGTAALSQQSEAVPLDSIASADAVLAGIPALVRKAASRVVEEQQRNPKGWLDTVKGWQSLYEAMKRGEVTPELQRPAVEAQAILNGFDYALQGKQLPLESVVVDAAPVMSPTIPSNEKWGELCERALNLYRDKVSDGRYKQAQRSLPSVSIVSVSLEDVQAGLLAWCKRRLNEVKPRTVKTQLDCMVSSLRCVLPKLQAPFLKELQGVMQPRNGDRQSMPVQVIKEAMVGFKNRPVSNKVRKGYGGGASQFDAVAVEALAVLGIRPRELVQAKLDAICEKTDVFGGAGLFFRITSGKNRASERDIPLSDGEREVLDLVRLREMLAWQQDNPRSFHGAVSSLNTRFSDMTGGYTLYQMRHSWKDLAVCAGVDSELRERLMGHKVPGVAAVYGSGVPLDRGLDALLSIREKILGEKR